MKSACMKCCSVSFNANYTLGKLEENKGEGCHEGCDESCDESRDEGCDVDFLKNVIKMQERVIADLPLKKSSRSVNLVITP